MEGRGGEGMVAKCDAFVVPGGPSYASGGQLRVVLFDNPGTLGYCCEDDSHTIGMIVCSTA